MLAEMLLKREKLPYRPVLPGMAEVLQQKLVFDSFKENEELSCRFAQIWQ